VNISGMTALITGATGGIGRAVSEALARKNVHLILVARVEDKDLELKLLGFGAISVKWHICDLLRKSQFTELCEKLAHEKIDVLFNNAGLLTGGLLEKQTELEIENMFDVNLVKLVLLTRVVLPGMLARGSGLIINNSSISGVMNLPAASTYAAAKAGVIAFHRSLELELAATPLRMLLLITPGIKTKMFDQIGDLYGSHFKWELQSISAEAYAEIVITAIERGQRRVTPSGVQWLSMQVAHYFPGAFRYFAGVSFKRSDGA
jgi:short-subunit dehydrogenase